MPVDQTPADAIATLYVAYFGRAPDPEGFAYWQDRFEGQAQLLGDAGAVTAIANAFADSEEARARYPLLATETDQDPQAVARFIDAVYRNTFDRSPEGRVDDATSGLGGWTAAAMARIADGRPVGAVVADIAFGAQGPTVVEGYGGAADIAVDDATRLAAKVAATKAFAADTGTTALPDDAPANAPYRVVDAAGRVSRDPDELVAFAQAPAPESGLVVRVLGDPETVERYGDPIEATAEAAWQVWTARFARTAEIELVIDFNPGTAVARGTAAISVETGETAGGMPIEMTGVAWELATGEDPNGASTDARVTLETQPGRFAYRTDASQPLAPDKLDALTVMVHEFGHILGVTSRRDDRAVDGPAVLSAWDRHVDPGADGASFAGPAARLVFGGPVPLVPGDDAHVDTASSIMEAGIAFGESAQASELDFAMIQDIGVPVGANPVELFA